MPYVPGPSRDQAMQVCLMGCLFSAAIHTECKDLHHPGTLPGTIHPFKVSSCYFDRTRQVAHLEALLSLMLQGSCLTLECADTHVVVHLLLQVGSLRHSFGLGTQWLAV